MNASSNDPFDDYIALRTALRLSDQAHAAVEMRAFPRHFGVVTFFVSLAWSLDLQFSAIVGVLSWLVLRLFRATLWRWGLHERNLWNWLFFVRIFVFRWLMALTGSLVFLFRSPTELSEIWVWLAAVFLFDILLLVFVEGKEYDMANAERERLDSAMADLMTRSQEPDRNDEPTQAEAHSEMVPDSNQRDELARNAIRLIMSYRGSVIDSETAELRAIQNAYEVMFDGWEEFSDSVMQRLCYVLLVPEIEHIAQDLVEQESHSLDSWYLMAAEDIRFSTGVSEMYGADRAGVDAFRSWITHLLRKELELGISSRIVETGPETNRTSLGAQGLAGFQPAIESLLRLRDLGVLSDEEYGQKRRELLGKYLTRDR